MEGSKEFSEQGVVDDVVVSILTTGLAADMNKGGDTSSKLANKAVSVSGNELPDQEKNCINTQMPPEITKISPLSTPQRPRKVPNELTRRNTLLARTALLKSKSRLFEPSYSCDEALSDESFHLLGSNMPLRTPKVSPRVSIGTPAVPESPCSSLGKDEEGEEEVYQTIDLQVKKPTRKKFNVFVLIEWIIFVSLMGILIGSLNIHHFNNTSIWSLGLWKWCVLVIVIFCGRLVTGWFIAILVYLVERQLLLERKVMYFVHGLKKIIRVILWLSFVLLAWMLLFIHGNTRSRRTKRNLHYITMAIAGCLVGAGIWLLKTILVKILALSFHVRRFFDRIQESLFHQYVLQILSGPPFMEMAGESLSRTRTSGQLNLERMITGGGVKEEVINVGKLHKINIANVSAWTMKGLIDVIRKTKLSTISNTLDYGDEGGTCYQKNEITSEWEAKVASVQIFNNVAKPGHKYIEEEDLLSFMKWDEVNQVFPLFEGAIETGKIKKSALLKWVVESYLERKSLAHSLNDTKTAVEELNKIASALVLVVITLTWNLMMGFLTTQVLVFLTSQFLLVAFMFGNTVKTVFEAIIFVFIMHPFDVGDRCLIDGVQMVVEEMNILTTIFLKYDNEKITYPNSVLAKKPISNYYRSPEMSDSVEFALGFSTTIDTIAAVKIRIKMYIESKPEHWRPSHCVQMEEIMDMSNIKMALYVTHTINFQDIAAIRSRRSDLVLELKKIFLELGVVYQFPPQEVQVAYVRAPASASVSQS